MQHQTEQVGCSRSWIQRTCTWANTGPLTQMPPPPYYILSEQRQWHLKPLKPFSSSQVLSPNLSRSEKQSQLWIESKRQSTIKCQSNFTNQSNVNNKAEKNKSRLDYLQIPSFISNTSRSAVFGDQRVAWGLNTNPGAKLGCGWVFFCKANISYALSHTGWLELNTTSTDHPEQPSRCIKHYHSPKQKV